MIQRNMYVCYKITGTVDLESGSHQVTVTGDYLECQERLEKLNLLNTRIVEKIEYYKDGTVKRYGLAKSAR